MASLNGTQGFKILGENAGDNCGISVSTAGDVNGDTIPDILIGADWADPNSVERAGKAYVVFGNSLIGRTGKFPLTSLDGSNGFSIIGSNALDYIGYSVDTAGDINGDGKDEILISAPLADPNGINDAGTANVIFGSTTVGSSGSIALANLDGNNGFKITGEEVNDQVSISLSTAGDINGDGKADILIGAAYANPNSLNDAGKTYVIFGSTTVGRSGTLALANLDGINGFTILGENTGDLSGWSVKTAGDVNDDGKDDILIGAPYADTSQTDAGKSYVIFGSSTVGSSGSIALTGLDGTNGFKILGENAGDNSGWSVSTAGDINGDGIADILIGTPFASPSANLTKAGKSYVIFGGPSLGNSGSFALSSLDGTNGFTILGEAANDLSGVSVSTAGDVNGDGAVDIIIGSQNASPNGLAQAGISYVIFGKKAVSTPTPPPTTIQPTTMPVSPTPVPATSLAPTAPATTQSTPMPSSIIPTTQSPTLTQTATVTSTPGISPTPTLTQTATATSTPGISPTPTLTQAATVTSTPGISPTPSVTTAKKGNNAGAIAGGVVGGGVGIAVLIGLGIFGYKHYQKRQIESDKPKPPERPFTNQQQTINEGLEMDVRASHP